MLKLSRIGVAALPAAFAGALCIAAPVAHAQLVKIDGSSTVFPITEAMAEDFQKSTKGKVKVTVGISGTGGGFKLTRPASCISLADIIEAVEGPIAMTTCVDDSRDDCALDHHCAVKPHWGVVNGAVRGALASVSLTTLSEAR